MATVYRIASADGRGICVARTGLCDSYWGGESAKHHCPKSNFGEDAERAFLMTSLCGWKFGYASLEQLQHWFPDAAGRRRMKELGALLYVYDVPEGDIIYDKDGNQLIFDRSAAHETETLDVETLK